MNRFEEMFRDILEAQTFWFPCPAEVLRFDSTKQTADVRPFFTIGGERAPEVKGAPVLLPSGAGWEIDFHLQAGDHVLAVFTSHNIFLWRAGQNADTEADTPRLSDAVVLPGLARTTGRTAGTSSGLTLRNSGGTVELTLTDSGIEAKGSVTVTGNLSVTGTVTALSSTTPVGLTTHVHPIGSPNTSPPVAPDPS